MYSRLSRTRRGLPVALGVVALTGVAALFAWDGFPGWFPAGVHDVLGAFPLAMIAVAYLAYRAAHRPGWMEMLKAGLLAAAFLLWAANQLWPLGSAATLFNDGAIGLFVLDVFLVIVGWPANLADGSFGESHPETAQVAGVDAKLE